MYSETGISVGLGLISFIFAYLAVNREANDGVKVMFLFSCLFMMIANLAVLEIQATTDNQTAIANLTGRLILIPATIIILMFLYYFMLLLYWSMDIVRGKKTQQDDEL